MNCRKSTKPICGGYRIFSMVNSGKELPQGTHADRFDENEQHCYSKENFS
jgi:hypothetical protein